MLIKILQKIEKKFIGQETAVEHLFYNIINNQQLAGNKDAIDGQRSIIFLDGPTGTGKTAITKEITDKLGIPFTASSITNYSSAGYKGADLTDILEDLYKNIVPDKKYISYEKEYKDDIDRYVETSEILIGKNAHNLENRKQIMEEYKKYKKYLPYEIGALIILSIIVMLLK